MSKGNKSNHPKKYVYWSDWESWLLKEWQPFKTNHFQHLKKRVARLEYIAWAILLAVLAKTVIDIFWG